jgi:hypothetical protein
MLARLQVTFRSQSAGHIGSLRQKYPMIFKGSARRGHDVCAALLRVAGIQISLCRVNGGLVKQD